MSWIRRDARLSDTHKGQFTYSVSESLVYSISTSSLISPRERRQIDSIPRFSKRTIRDSADWDQYLEDSPCKETKTNESRINLVLAGKRPVLSNLPFSKSTFLKIVDEWNIHSSIARVINRKKSCHFGRISHEWTTAVGQAKSFVYNCRTVDTWEDDIALSVTWFPDTLTTNAVWYGCGLEKRSFHGWTVSDADIITRRLENFDGPVFHPMMIPTLFAEFERERLVTLSRADITELVRKLNSLADPDVALARLRSKGSDTIDSECEEPSTLMSRIRRRLRLTSKSSCKREGSQDDCVETTATTSTEQDHLEDDSTVLVWLRLSELRHGLESWRVQLVKMVDHMEELEKLDYCLAHESAAAFDLKLSALRDSGERILGRLQELLFECDEAARNCARAMEGMSLVNQLEANAIGRHDNLMNQRTSANSLILAKSARRDAEIMKLIAVLGMVFLPGMFTSSFFSIGFFEYRDDKHLSVPQYIWIWASVTLLATVLTIILFRISTHRRLQKVAKGNGEGVV